MLNKFYFSIIQYSRLVLALIVVITIVLASQLTNLEWETDARVYMPKGHPAILYDEIIEETFGVKNAVIIGIVNQEKGIYNPETLARITRITEQVATLPGIIANRTIDVMSLSTASAFVGDAESIGSDRLMDAPPSEPEAIDRLKQKVLENEDLFIGNIVSADGTAAVIRAKLKEGKNSRYSAYFAIKSILATENGQLGDEWDTSGWASSKEWQGNQWQKGNSDKTWPSSASDKQLDSDQEIIPAFENGDIFYLAGRPVIEVTSGLNALDDIYLMVPLLILVIVVVLFLIFRTMRGVILPLAIVTVSVIWTMGTMAVFNVPMYTISTMLPVILVAVGIGDAIHLLSNYYDNVLRDPYRDSKIIVLEVCNEIGPPLIITTITTAIGFLALTLAEMPPFKIFGLFTVIGIFYCWLLSVTLIPAALTLLKPKVGGYLSKRRALRVHGEDSTMTRLLAAWARYSNMYTNRMMVILFVGIFIVAYGSMSLIVNSSWMSDFKKDSDISIAHNLLNERFDGTIFLNAVIEGKHPDALKSPLLLAKIEALQNHIEAHPYVGDSVSIVDYLKSLNKNLHAGDDRYDVLPSTQQEISEYLFLLSMAGRPDELNEVIDYEYRQANVSFLIKTDYTQDLKSVIDEVNDFVDHEFKELDVDVNMAGSANNSYIWADLLIDSQIKAILVSKIGIFLIAALLFSSITAGLLTVIPVTLTTLFVAGVSGFIGIPVDVSTVLAAGVAIGVGVDFAVHYLFRYRKERLRSGNHLDATFATMRTVGKTIVFNAVVVTLGFMVLIASQFPPHVKLGSFVTAYMVVSCLTALMILPLFFKYFGSRIAQRGV